MARPACPGSCGGSVPPTPCSSTSCSYFEALADSRSVHEKQSGWVQLRQEAPPARSAALEPAALVWERPDARALNEAQAFTAKDIGREVQVANEQAADLQQSRKQRRSGRWGLVSPSPGTPHIPLPTAPGGTPLVLAASSYDTDVHSSPGVELVAPRRLLKQSGQR